MGSGSAPTAGGPTNDVQGSGSTPPTGGSLLPTTGSDSTPPTGGSLIPTTDVQGSGSTSMTGIKVPPVMKRRGRPRGHELTVIGFPAKKAKKDTIKRPQCFSKMHTSKKQEGWFGGLS